MALDRFKRVTPSFAGSLFRPSANERVSRALIKVLLYPKQFELTTIIAIIDANRAITRHVRLCRFRRQQHARILGLRAATSELATPYTPSILGMARPPDGHLTSKRQPESLGKSMRGVSWRPRRPRKLSRGQGALPFGPPGSALNPAGLPSAWLLPPTRCCGCWAGRATGRVP